MTNNQIELKVQELTNTYYSYSDLEDYLRNSADDIGENNKWMERDGNKFQIYINWRLWRYNSFNSIIN